jgi:hypothetical protein
MEGTQQHIPEPQPGHPYSGRQENSLLYDLFFCRKIPPYLSDELRFPWGTDRGVPAFHTGEGKPPVKWLVKDIPGFIKVQPSLPQGWACREVPQYSGYAVDLAPYPNMEALLVAQLNSRNRKNLRAKNRKFEALGGISYKVYTGAMDADEYLELMDRFYHLLKDRFDQKKMYNRNLLHWPFLVKNAYPLIESGDAFLFVIRHGETPISMSLNYRWGQMIFSFIQTFHPDYTRYDLGHLSTHKKLDWCMRHGIRFYDFSIGGSYFKEKWANTPYRFSYYLLYRKGSVKARLWVFITTNKLRLLQWLRDRGVLGKWFQLDKFFYRRQRKKIEGFDWKRELQASGGLFPQTPKDPG